jgi:cytochrome c5
MKSPAATLVAAATFFLWTHASADTGEEVYKNRCSLCHAGGAGGAPKFGNREDWAPRAARGKIALYEVALRGKPNTAMMPRGGFRDLSNDEVMAAADYMLARAGLNPGNGPEAPAASPAAVVALPPVRPAAEVDDGTITAGIADALCELAPPGAKVEMSEETANIGGLGIKVTTREGVVSLTGMVNNAEIIERAEAIAKSAAGVKKVESKLIAASIFEWD